MSFQPDNVEHEFTIEELLLRIIQQNNILIAHNEIITGENITEDDLDDDS